MKLKYIFLTMAAAATFGACTQDQLPTPPQGEAMVSLSLGVDNGAITTKADGDMQDLNGLAGEANVNRLSIFLFNGNTLVVKKDTTDTAGNLDRIGNVIVPAGTYDIIIVANAPDALYEGVTSMSTLKTYQSALKETSSPENTPNTAYKDMLMVSKLYEGVQLVALNTAGNTPGTDDELARLTYNYLGDSKKIEADLNRREIGTWYKEGATKKVLLTRLTARIQVKSIAVSFKEDLVGAKFTLDSIYVANVRPATYLLPTSGSFEATPAAAPFYLRSAPATVSVVHNLIYPADNAVSPLLKPYLPGSALTIDDKATHTYDATNRPFWYAYENQTAAADGVYNTRLVIAGRITTKAGVTLPVSYYTVLIQDESKLVERNKIYQVSVTISGLGSHNVDELTENAVITATVTAEKWKIVIHEEEITD